MCDFCIISYPILIKKQGIRGLAPYGIPHENIPETGMLQGMLNIAFVKLRHIPGVRCGPHINNNLDGIFLQQVEESIHTPV